MKTWERDRERHIICIGSVPFWKQTSRRRERDPHLSVATGPSEQRRPLTFLAGALRSSRPGMETRVIIRKTKKELIN